MRGVFVPDGYTETLPVDSLDGSWPDGQCIITFRPPVGWELDELLSNPKSGPEWLAKRIIKWNIVDDHGVALPITAENIGRLKSSFYVRLQSVVAGWATDKDGKPLQHKRDEDLKN